MCYYCDAKKKKVECTLQLWNNTKRKMIDDHYKNTDSTSSTAICGTALLNCILAEVVVCSIVVLASRKKIAPK